MKLVKGIAFFAVLAAPVVGFAEDAAVTGVEWKNNVALGATYKSGNTEKSLFTVNVKGERYGAHNDLISSLYAEYGKTGTPTTDKEQTEGQVRANSEYRHKFNESKFFGGVFAEGRHDAIKGLRAQFRVGPNIGYYFLDQENMKLDASFGLNYVYERTSANERTYGEYRVAANFLWDITKASSYYMNVEYSANMEESDIDNGGLLVTGVRSKLYEDLSMFIELRDEYDNLPDTVGSEHNDVTVLAGLSFDF